MSLRRAAQRRSLCVWLQHLKIFADLFREVVVDFVVARDARGFLGGRFT
jgi:hypothetical protein